MEGRHHVCAFVAVFEDPPEKGYGDGKLDDGGQGELQEIRGAKLIAYAGG